jgi:hypothetical protein
MYMIFFFFRLTVVIDFDGGGRSRTSEAAALHRGSSRVVHHSLGPGRETQVDPRCNVVRLELKLVLTGLVCTARHGMGRSSAH